MEVDYSYVRPLKAKSLEQWHEEIIKRDSLDAKEFQNATILPLCRFQGDNLLFGRGGVVDCENNYIESSSINKRVQYAYETDCVEYRDETVVYCGYLVNQWGHFLVEGVARLWYYLKDDTSVDKYVFFVEKNNNRAVVGNYKEFFELLGIWDRLEIINTPVKYKKVIIPELGYCWKTYYSEEYKSIFSCVRKNAIESAGWIPSDKIFLSRSKLKSAKSKELGLDMLDDFFQKNGYEILFPERLSLSELIYKLNHAERIASLSGSLPHNLLFAEDKKDLLIIERNVLNNEIQADINQIKDLNVIYVDANLPIYSINLGWGPFIMAYTGPLEKFSKEKGYSPPHNRFQSKKYMKHLLARYMKEYWKEYHYEWFMEDWSIKYSDYLREGYQAGYEYYKEYLTGKKPFLLQHYFMPYYWKNGIKRIIRALSIFRVRI